MRQAVKKPSDFIKQGWCRFTYARDVRGKRVPVSDSSACQWCLVGAILAAENTGWHWPSGAFERFMSLLERKPAGWQDAPGRSQADVLALLEELGI